MDIREEFEKLREVKKDIENYRLRYNKKLNAYTGLDGKIKNDAIWVNGAWYAFQEQQKKIDAIKSKLSDIYDASDEDETVAHLLDEIQELLK